MRASHATSHTRLSVNRGTRVGAIISPDSRTLTAERRDGLTTSIGEGSYWRFEGIERSGQSMEAVA